MTPYESYRQFCARVGVEPLKEEKWAELTTTGKAKAPNAEFYLGLPVKSRFGMHVIK